MEALRVAEPPAGTEWPAEVREPQDDPLRVVAGSRYGVRLGLVHDNWPAPAALHPGEVVLEVESLEGAAPVVEGELGPSGALWVVLEAGARARFRLERGDVSWTSGELLGVDPAEIKQLEVVVGIARETPWLNSSAGVPVAAHAVARDREGRLVVGAVVHWDVTAGELQLAWGDLADGRWSLFPLGGQDFIWLADVCGLPSESWGKRRATVRARYEGLTASKAFTWQRVPSSFELQERGDDALPMEADPAQDDGWEKPSQCVGPGCTGGCAAGGRTPVRLVGLPMLILLRRRRGGSPDEP